MSSRHLQVWHQIALLPAWLWAIFWLWIVPMSKKFIADVIQQSSDLTGLASVRLAGAVIEAIKAEIVETGRFSLPEFGSFSVRETPKRTKMNPRTGEKVQVKAGATVRFKPSPNLKEAVFAGVKKARRKAAKAG